MPTPTWLGPIRQTAFVVPDIEAAARQWVDVHGVGPWFLYNVDIPGTQYRGQELPMRAHMGLARSGGQQIELIQPDPDVPSIYNEFLAAGGTRVHHACYRSDLDRAVAHFVAQGGRRAARGDQRRQRPFAFAAGLDRISRSPCQPVRTRRH